MMTASSAGSVVGAVTTMKLIHTTLFIIAITVADAMASGNRLYSEGGSYSAQSDQPQQRSTTADGYGGGGAQQSSLEYYDTEYQEPNLYRTQSLPMRTAGQEHQRERLVEILKELQRKQPANPATAVNFAKQEDDEPVLNPQEPRERNRNAKELEELQRLSMEILARQQFDSGNTEPPMDDDQSTWSNGVDAGIKMAAVKKGQSEFVEFVEPPQHNNNNRLKATEWMEKRVPADLAYGDDEQQDSNYESPFKFFANSGNVLYVAYLAICCVGIIAGVVGGLYYYNHVRAARVDDPFNEFTHYSPSGPSKEKLKKGAKSAGAQGFSQTGDEALAYKAQLQHYQQQKQKILGMPANGAGANDTMSDNEDDTDELEHNFSVFECPGLAPTGDVEIQNPNFVGDDNGNGKKDASKEQHTD